MATRLTVFAKAFQFKQTGVFLLTYNFFWGGEFFFKSSGYLSNNAVFKYFTDPSSFFFFLSYH